MTAPTKIWTVPVPARQDPAAPITTSWGNDTWDNLQFLMEWLGADYLVAAAQNHNHDGLNSAKVNVFEGLMPNGSFEEVSAGLPISWTATPYTGGTVASSAATNKHGDKVLAITSTVLANGGGEAIPDDYKAVTNNANYGFEIYRWASAANISCRVQLLWYNSAKALISTTTVFTDTNTPVGATLSSAVYSSPANARFVRVKVIGGVPATGTAVGTVYFDGGYVSRPLVVGSVNYPDIAPGAVHTSTLNTSTATTSTTATELGFVMSGGQYVFSLQSKASSGAAYSYGSYSTAQSANVWTTSTSYVTAMVIGQGAAGPTVSAEWRYINASPPYDLGDGEIQLFAFVQIDNTTGEVISVSLAPDPVWTHNGPTNCCPDGYEDGNAYKWVREYPAGLSPREKIAAIHSAPKIKRMITQQLKHADMDIIPHPFIGNDLTGTTVVMLDPVSDVMAQLAQLRADGEDVNKLIHDKYLTIGNSALQRHGPAGLLIPRVAWK